MQKYNIYEDISTQKLLSFIIFFLHSFMFHTICLLRFSIIFTINVITLNSHIVYYIEIIIVKSY